MDSYSILPSVIAIIILLVFSAYFSATETAFTSLNRIRMKNKADDGDERAKKVLELERNYDSLLSTILIGNNLVNIANTAIATVLFVELFGAYGATISTVVTTIFVLIFGEISPKSVAKEHAEGFALFSAPIINFIRIILTPVNWIFAQWKKLLSKIFGAGNGDGITEDELLTIVEESEAGGGISGDQARLIENAITFSSLDAWDVLTPRVDMEAISLDTPHEEIAETFISTGYSRLPVHDDDLDNILGILTYKDFHNYVEGRDRSIADYIKPVIYVAGSMKAADILSRLQNTKCRMAVIVDEYGGTAGIVTVEDIVEELVGEIYDDGDVVILNQDIIPLQDGSYRVRAAANIDKLLDYFDEEDDIDATTVNGWAVLQLDRLPKVGDVFEYRLGDRIFRGRVTKADDRKATEINLRVIDVPQEEPKKGNKHERVNQKGK